jgi:hypothetical protein
MISLLDLVSIIGGASEQALRYLENHHWFFGFILFACVFHHQPRAIDVLTSASSFEQFFRRRRRRKGRSHREKHLQRLLV